MRCAELLPSLLQLLAVIDQRSHLGFCRTSSLCHCGKEIEVTKPIPFIAWSCYLIEEILCIVSFIFLWGTEKALLCLHSALQVNIGILISVTRIISRISGESYKIHGDANAVKYDIFPSFFFLPLLKKDFQSNKFNPCSQCEVCVLFQAHCKGSGCASSNTGHFLDLWRPRCQFTLLGIPLHFCHL